MSVKLDLHLFPRILERRLARSLGENSRWHRPICNDFVQPNDYPVLADRDPVPPGITISVSVSPENSGNLNFPMFSTIYRSDPSFAHDSFEPWDSRVLCLRYATLTTPRMAGRNLSVPLWGIWIATRGSADSVLQMRGLENFYSGHTPRARMLQKVIEDHPCDLRELDKPLFRGFREEVSQRHKVRIAAHIGQSAAISYNPMIIGYFRIVLRSHQEWWPQYSYSASSVAADWFPLFSTN